MGLGTQGGFLQPGQELDLAPGPAGGTAVSGVCLWNTTPWDSRVLQTVSEQQRNHMEIYFVFYPPGEADSSSKPPNFQPGSQELALPAVSPMPGHITGRLPGPFSLMA